MEEREASRVVTEWVERHPDRETAEHVFRPLEEAVASLVPDEATARIADLDGTRSIIAVADGMFLMITIDLTAAGEQGEVRDRSPEVTCQALPLDRGTATIEVHEHRIFASAGRLGSPRCAVADGR